VVGFEVVPHQLSPLIAPLAPIAMPAWYTPLSVEHDYLPGYMESFEGTHKLNSTHNNDYIFLILILVCSLDLCEMVEMLNKKKADIADQTILLAKIGEQHGLQFKN
jgi:hypothetical protein